MNTLGYMSHPLTLCLNRKQLPDIVWPISVAYKANAMN